jgi:protein gp37
VFPSVCDPFDNEVDPAWRARFFALIASTPRIDWLLLTKRIGNVAKMIEAPGMQKCGLPDNVWLGATVVNQEEADRDIPKLLATPTRVRFLSIEPMLGPICIEQATDKSEAGTIDWVIAGGESGPHARPAHPEWFRELRDECEAFGVPFLFKQWGEWTPGENVERVRGTVDTAFLDDSGWRIYPLNLATDHGHIDDQPDLYRVGPLPHRRRDCRTVQAHHAGRRADPPAAPVGHQGRAPPGRPPAGLALRCRAPPGGSGGPCYRGPGIE